MCKQFFLLMLLVSFLSACATVGNEVDTYPDSWPKLVSSDCTAPLGIFSNLPDDAVYEYENDVGKRPMSLEQAFNSFHGSSHLNIQLASEGNYQISFFNTSDSDNSINAEITLTDNDYSCKENRFTLVSDTVHETFRGYQDPEYSPLYTAAYTVGTLGLAAPISQWWEYRFALAEDGSLIIRRLETRSGLLLLMYTRTVMSDDWFKFEQASLALQIVE